MQEAGTVTYTLVVSQYEKNVTIQYTLRAYSTAPILFSPIVDPYTATKTVSQSIFLILYLFRKKNSFYITSFSYIILCTEPISSSTEVLLFM